MFNNLYNSVCTEIEALKKVSERQFEYLLYCTYVQLCISCLVALFDKSCKANHHPSMFRQTSSVYLVTLALL